MAGSCIHSFDEVVELKTPYRVIFGKEPGQ